MSELYLEDLENYDNHLFIHTVFGILLVIQFLLFLMLRKLLNPLNIIQNKLKNLQKGDMSKLKFDSSYDEINQIITSYNNSISQLEYIIDTRELFNKIFMHELKMPLAKGMFYLKLEPSKELNAKMTKLLQSINDELDEFSTLESLIMHRKKIRQSKHDFLDLLDSAIEKMGSEKNENITIHSCEDCYVWGDKELWILCFKNLLDNGFKYATDNKVIITCKTNEISFSNHGDPLPVDILNDLDNWKIDKNQRHKSSTGYGFGLFIIKNIVKLNRYELDYIHENGFLTFKIKNYGAKY
jgi:two-component system OmpR family sensor kinase